MRLSIYIADDDGPSDRSCGLSFFASKDLARAYLEETGRKDLRKMAVQIVKLFPHAMAEYAHLGQACTNRRLAESHPEWEDVRMASDTLTALLKLSAGERAELAMALWASLDDEARSAELALAPEQVVELERRFTEHQADPSTGRPWDEVQQRLRNRR